MRAVARRPSVRYAPVARAAYKVAKAGYSAYKSYKKRKVYQKSGSTQTDSSPIYGTAFTSKITYSKRRPNKKRARRGRASFKSFISNSLKLQNAQNAVRAGYFTAGNAIETQAWFSLDFLNVEALREFSIGQLPSGTTATQWRDFTLYLKSFSLKTMIQNTGTSNVSMDIYWVIPKRDITMVEMGSPTGHNGNVLSSWFVTNTSSAGLPTIPPDMNADPAGDDIPSAVDLGFNPFMYQNFCRLFTIVKIRTVVLGAGQTFEDRSKIGSRRVNMAKLGGVAATANSNLQPLWYNKGYAKSMLVRIRGFPDADHQSSATSVAVAWEETATSKVMQTRPGTTATLGDA